jgi:hypothetical protein
MKHVINIMVWLTLIALAVGVAIFKQKALTTLICGACFLRLLDISCIGG